MSRPTRSCPGCGAEVPARAAGCPRCGHIFQEVEGGSAPPPVGARATAAVEVEATRAGSTGWKPVLAVTCGCFALVAAAGAATAWLGARLFADVGAQFLEVQQEADLIGLRAALEAYADDHDGRYPSELEALTRRNGEGPWIERLPTDRWGRPFRFEPPPDGRRTSGPGRLYTLGADGEPGGEGPDADQDEQALGLRREGR
jgi:hypothetical protein